MYRFLLKQACKALVRIRTGRKWCVSTNVSLLYNRNSVMCKGTFCVCSYLSDCVYVLVCLFRGTPRRWCKWPWYSTSIDKHVLMLSGWMQPSCSYIRLRLCELVRKMMARYIIPTELRCTHFTTMNAAQSIKTCMHI